MCSNPKYILLDDSEDLKLHREQVGKTLRVMGKLVKQFAKGSTLSVKSLGSEAPGSNIIKSAKSTNLEKAVAGLRFDAQEKSVEQAWSMAIHCGIAAWRDELGKKPDSAVAFYLLTACTWDPAKNFKFHPLVALASYNEGSHDRPVASVQIIKYGQHAHAAENIDRIRKGVQRSVGPDKTM